MVYKSCSVCGQSYERPGEDQTLTCSSKCTNLSNEVSNFADEMVTFKDPDDQRIFFYDVGFGDLCDRYCILMLRKSHEKSLGEKKETEFHIGRLRRAILTKINRCGYDQEELDKIANLLDELVSINAHMWRIRHILRSLTDNEPSRIAWFESYWQHSENRDRVRGELDMYVEGRIRTVRVWNA